jgi:opacity protein-like surface antigen
LELFEMRTVRIAAALLALAAPASAQEPQAPPPPPGKAGGEGASPHELLPGIGKIGAQAGFFLGASFNPYEIGEGLDLGGFVDLPLVALPGGKLSYEIALGMSLATSDPFEVTSAVAFVANLAAGASPQDALAGPPHAPFPVRRSVRSELRLLHLSPFSLKYTITALDGARLRPYLGAGLDFVAVITREDPESDESLLFTGSAPFDDPLIAGLIAQAPELTARGRPTGQGNFELGGHAAAGVEVRLSRGLSLNLEYRFTATEGTKGRLQTATGALGFHW